MPALAPGQGVQLCRLLVAPVGSELIQRVVEPIAGFGVQLKRKHPMVH